MELKELLEYSFSELIRGGADRKHPFRFVTLSTVTEEGTPDSRMVVMRKFSKEELSIKIYTDRRSHKVEQLKKQPVAILLFWNSRKRLQLKVKAQFTQLPPEEGDLIYQQLPEQGISSYNTLLAPGTPVEDIAEAHQWQAPSNGDHFLILQAQLLELEALKLEDKEHLRAKYYFNLSNNELSSAKWLVP